MSEIFLSQGVLDEIMRKIAYSSSSYFANDLYFKMSAVQLFISSVGEEKVKKMLLQCNDKILKKIGEKWESFILYFDKILTTSSIAKLSQDLIKDKEFKKNEEYDKMVSDLKKMGVIRPQIIALYVFFIENSAIKNMTIPREYYKIIEHSGYKVILDANKRKVGDATNKQI